MPIPSALITAIIGRSVVEDFFRDFTDALCVFSCFDEVFAVFESEAEAKELLVLLLCMPIIKMLMVWTLLNV